MPRPASIESAVRDAAWLAHRYDPERDAFHFLPVPRPARDSATFLTDEFLPEGLSPLVVRRGEATAAKPSVAPLHFVFHSAFCCSTLIARAFERPGWTSALKEPVVLNDIIGWRRRGGKGPDMAGVLDAALTLLARPFPHDQAVIAKPSTAINALAPAVLTLRPEAKALLLYAPLRTYLASIAKKGLDGRLWVRTLLLGMIDDGIANFGFSARDQFGHSDLQVAAIGWLGQRRLFANLVERFGVARVRALDSSTLMAKPTSAIEALISHFDLSADRHVAQQIVMGEAFNRHSKLGMPFDASDRAAEHHAAALTHADEVEKVALWAEKVAAMFDIDLGASAALVT